MLDQGMYNATLGNSCINWMVSLNSTYFMAQNLLKCLVNGYLVNIVYINYLKYKL